MYGINEQSYGKAEGNDCSCLCRELNGIQTYRGSPERPFRRNIYGKLPLSVYRERFRLKHGMAKYGAKAAGVGGSTRLTYDPPSAFLGAAMVYLCFVLMSVRYIKLI